jgi:hypothetical protein
MTKSLLLLSVPLLLLAACGGSGTSTIGPTPPPPNQVIATPGPPNVEPLVLEAGPANALNTAFVSVTVCVPGSQQCQTIDNIEVDTGSSGLRILKEVLTLQLPPHSHAGGLPFAECLQFADGSSFGPLAEADLQMPTSQKSVARLTVQVIGDPNYDPRTTTCPMGLKYEQTVTDFGANGILGVGPFAQDCGAACADAVSFPDGWYYTCPTPTSCVAASASVTEQVQQPVTLFGSDDNGVIVEVPSPPSNGTAQLTGGALVFGIGTGHQNDLGSAAVLMIDPSSGFIQASFNGANGLNAALDSGSNANFFTDSSIPECKDPKTGQPLGFFCPDSPLNFSASLYSAGGGAAVTAEFTVDNLLNLLQANTSAAVLPNIGGPLQVSNQANVVQFDLGMPYFFGRNVFTAIENQPTPAGNGPYFAF